MNKDRKSMLRDAVVLFAITLIAGLILGGVYQVTKEPIAAQKEKARQEACREVFAEAASFEAVDSQAGEGAEYRTPRDGDWTERGYGGVDIGEVMRAADAGGGSLGYVITVTAHEGYGGDIQFMMGVREDGTLNGISLLSISETAGLGMRAEEVLKPQFAGRGEESFFYGKGGAAPTGGGAAAGTVTAGGAGQIDAITGATITTSAIVDGVNAGLYYFRSVLAEGGNSNG